jgi:hypothetical protein
MDNEVPGFKNICPQAKLDYWQLMKNSTIRKEK